MKWLSAGWMLAASMALAGVVQGQDTLSPAAASSVATSPAPLDEAAQELLLARATELVKAKQHAEAVAGPIDQIIHNYESAYAHSKKRIYNATSPAESLLYLVTAAKDKVDAQVLGKPTWSSAYYLKAYALEELDNLPEAEASLLQALKLAPARSGFLSELGNVYERQKDWPKALQAFKQAEDTAGISDKSKETPERCRALRGQGYVLVELRQLDEAQQKYRQCLKLDPGNQASANEVGYIEKLKSKPAGQPPVSAATTKVAE
ncbi:tetratricopeptide repeat protein [Dyella silvatica]|uniref:tetratricopeptide repeat protein n=1 Tax=Dyella silvatica TaxID=2992128 RepID=UPI0022526040|nr:tetratricopeptide repeat protein [Dyella silvatica]